MGGAGGEAVVVDLSDRDHQLLGGGQESVEPGSDGDVVMARFDDLGESPDRDDAPRPGRREEVPVLHQLPDGDVGDVVRGEGEGIDAEPCLTGVERCGGDVDELGVARLLEELALVPILWHSACHNMAAQVLSGADGGGLRTWIH